MTDGDTFRCSDGTQIRLNAIDAPDIGQCRKPGSCAAGDPVKARAALSRIVLRQTLRCESTRMTKHLVTAWCRIRGADVSCAMYRGGWAVRLAQQDRPRRLCRHRSLTPTHLLPSYQGGGV